MQIRPFVDADLLELVELTVDTFRPFYEGHVRPSYGGELFAQGQVGQEQRRVRVRYARMI
jgi:hypothetical protein